MNLLADADEVIHQMRADLCLLQNRNLDDRGEELVYDLRDSLDMLEKCVYSLAERDQ